MDPITFAALLTRVDWNFNSYIILLLAVMCGILVFLDAYKGKIMHYSVFKSLVWGFFCFLLFPLTPIIYLIVRFLNNKANKLGL